MTVMESWAAKKPVVVSESETDAILADAVAPRFAQFTWGGIPARLLWHERTEWAYRKLAELRGEVPHGVETGEPCQYPACGCPIRAADGLPDCRGAAAALGVETGDKTQENKHA